MFGTYKPEDVTLLLKDITGMVQPQSTEEREKMIQSGTHYCEMLPIEYQPSEKYMEAFTNALDLYKKQTATAVGILAEKIYHAKYEKPVLVSLARAGTPIGILLKHYIETKYHINIPHYSISIIRGKGIDKQAMNYILRHHSAHNIQFVDGWTGKGAIKRQLDLAMNDYKAVDSGIAVLSDPAHVSSLCGTHDDFLIASCCLNSTVSGLLSRTFLRDDIIGKRDFHGAVFYKELMASDVTYKFINTIEQEFNFENVPDTPESHPTILAASELKNICHEFDINDINLVKPSIGEATRVLLRRVPWKILVHSLDDNEHLGHLYQLAKEKNVDVEVYPLHNYRACGIIKSIGDV